VLQTVFFWFDAQPLVQDDNPFEEGVLPSSIGRLSNLIVFSVARNHLVGAVPESISNLNNLVHVRCSLDCSDRFCTINRFAVAIQLNLEENLFAEQGESRVNLRLFKLLVLLALLQSFRTAARCLIYRASMSRATSSAAAWRR
jgi:hypothetical protein